MTRMEPVHKLASNYSWENRAKIAEARGKALEQAIRELMARVTQGTPNKK